MIGFGKPSFTSLIISAENLRFSLTSDTVNTVYKIYVIKISVNLTVC